MLYVLRFWSVARQQGEIHGDAFGRPAHGSRVVVRLRWDRQHCQSVPAGEPLPLLPGVKGERSSGVRGESLGRYFIERGMWASDTLHCKEQDCIETGTHSIQIRRIL